MQTISNYITESMKYPKTFKLSDKVTIKISDNWDRNVFSSLLDKAKESKLSKQSHEDFVDSDGKPYVIEYENGKYIINGEDIKDKQLEMFVLQMYL